MDEFEVIIPSYQCKKCGFTWPVNRNRISQVCPQCRSFNIHTYHFSP